ncbi:MAG: N-sulfoglucosamine sulfohydrolase [Gammaproteobacteria bacterium]|jgi:N-sulfoglucosamine sulfohydrolase|nr:N-sulfoglucosamine sulfohydrolase [Gammaproteobacteria bacterium]
MDRRDFLIGSTTGAAAVISKSRRVAAVQPRPNVLLIIADDQGLDAGCYGGTVRTPNLDRLATEGTLFTQGYATVSSCSPSRSVLYTGLYSHSNGMYGLAHDVHNQSLLDWVNTVPKLMSAAGYATALVGKKHIRPEKALSYDAELVPEKPGVRDVAALAAAAGQFIRAQAAKPFFITVGFSDPHRADENFGNTRSWPKVPRIQYAPNEVTIPAHLPDLPAVRADLAQYYESISRLDSGVGLLLAQLDETGHAQDTVVIFLSDNGRPFPGAKTCLYDEGIHLPLIIRAPGITRGVRCEAMVSWVDITPTILDLAHAPLPVYKLAGRSLLPVLNQARPGGWDRVFASHSFHEINQYYPMRAMRTARHTYIVNLAHELSFPIAGDVAASPSWKAIIASDARLGKRSLNAYLHRPAEELYDIVNDPDQLINVAGSADYRDTLRQMREGVREWRTATKDPWLAGQTSPFEHSH